MLADLQPVAFVPSTDLERSRRFYEETLGLPVVRADPFGVVVSSGSATIRISHVGRELRVQPFTVLGWQVEDMHPVIARLRESGVTLLQVEGLPQDVDGVWTAPDGTQVAWFTDPDGNTLSIDRPAGPRQPDE